jgi:hypothetical protein
LSRANLTFGDKTLRSSDICAGLTFANDNGLVWQSVRR